MDIKEIIMITLTSVSTGFLGFTLATLSKNRQLSEENMILRQRLRVMEKKYKPTDEDNVDMVDMRRMMYHMDEYIGYYYYQEYCMANNIMPAKDSISYITIRNTMMDDLKLQAKYPEYWERMK